MKLATVVLGLLFSSYVASATMSASTLFGWLPSLFPLTNVFPLNLLPFPLALPLAMVGPLPWVLPLAVGIKGATLLGLGFATGGVAGVGLAGLGAIGLKTAIANSAALKVSALGLMAAKAKVTSVAAQTVAQAGVKAIVAITNVKVFKSAPPRIAPRPLPVEQWKLSLPKGWDSSLSYGHPLYGYGFTRSAVELRKRREADSSKRCLRLQWKHDTTYAEADIRIRERTRLRKVRAASRLRGGSRAQPGWTARKDRGRVMTALSQEDASAPWMPYRDAAIAGQQSANRSQCLERYPSCTKSTESLVEMARSRISQASEIAAPAA
nr:uncharacterized protein LOC119168262 [Rhipicephalus microplus]